MNLGEMTFRYARPSRNCEGAGGEIHNCAFYAVRVYRCELQTASCSASSTPRRIGTATLVCGREDLFWLEVDY